MNDVTEVVFKICLSILEVECIDSASSPENILAWDSFAQVAILSTLEIELGIRFLDDELMEFFSVGDLCERVKEKLCQY